MALVLPAAGGLCVSASNRNLNTHVKKKEKRPYQKKGANDMIAYCGMDCSKCEGYLATQENSDTKRKEVAKKWTIQY